jgi:hypothetical protein
LCQTKGFNGRQGLSINLLLSQLGWYSSKWDINKNKSIESSNNRLDFDWRTTC